MQDASIGNDLVRKVLRSMTDMKSETAEEIQDRYTKLYPPSFFLRKLPSISIPNLKWALGILVREGYVNEEVTRFIDYELERDTKVYHLTQKGRHFTLKKK